MFFYNKPFQIIRKYKKKKKTGTREETRKKDELLNLQTPNFQFGKILEEMPDPIQNDKQQKFKELKIEKNEIKMSSFQPEKKQQSLDNSDTFNLKADEELEYFAFNKDTKEKNQFCFNQPENENVNDKNSQLEFFKKLDDYNYQFNLEKLISKFINFFLQRKQANDLSFDQYQTIQQSQKFYIFPSCYFKPYPHFQALPFQNIFSFREYHSLANQQDFVFNFDFSLQMRAQIIDWLMEVSRDFNLTKFTFSACVNYMDHFFANICNNHNKKELNYDCQIYAISSDDLQLIAAGCLLIASKIEEIQEINLAYLQSATAYSYSQEEIINTETAILKNLQFLLNSQTLMTWLDFVIYYWDLFISNVRNIKKEFKIDNYWLSQLENQKIRKNQNSSNFSQLQLALNYLHFDFNAYKNQELEACIATLFVFMFNLLSITDEQFQFSLIQSFLNFINPEGNNQILQIITIIQNLYPKLTEIFKHNLSIRSSPQPLSQLREFESDQIEQIALQEYYPKLFQFYTENYL